MSLIQTSCLALDRAQWRSMIWKKGCQCVTSDDIVLVAWALSQVRKHTWWHALTRRKLAVHTQWKTNVEKLAKHTFRASALSAAKRSQSVFSSITCWRSSLFACITWSNIVDSAALKCFTGSIDKLPSWNWPTLTNNASHDG